MGAYAGLVVVCTMVHLPCIAGLDALSLDPRLALCSVVCLPFSGRGGRAEVGCIVVGFLPRLGTRARAQGCCPADWAVVHG